MADLKPDFDDDSSSEEETDDDIDPSNGGSKINKVASHLIVLLILILCIVYRLSHSVLISIIITMISFILLTLYWLLTTDLSVEFTVWLARFLPASKQAKWDTIHHPSFKWTKIFRDNYQVILQEFLDFEQKYNYKPQFDDVFPIGAITNWDKKWPTVTLRCYNLDSKVSKFFPKTMNIVNNSSAMISHVMYSVLEPHKFIPRHRGPYRGVFRYQLSLEIPDWNNNPDNLYLAVWPGTSSYKFWDPDRVPLKIEPLIHNWYDGNDLIFDDTCVHEVHNNTSKRRIILFVDVERFDLNPFSKLLHRIFMSIAKYIDVIKKAIDVQDQFLESKEALNRLLIQERKRIESNDDEYRNNEWYKYTNQTEIMPWKYAKNYILNNNHASTKLKNINPELKKTN